MKRKDLVVITSGRRYDPPMSDPELWREVGRVLAERRVEKGYPTEHNFWTAKDHPPGAQVPDIATIKKIEGGRAKKLDVIGNYASLLGTRMEEVLAAAIPRADVPLKLRVLIRHYLGADAWLQESIQQMLRAHHAAKPKPQGDGQVVPVKRPGRSDRAR